MAHEHSDVVYLLRAVITTEDQNKVLFYSAPVGIICCTIVSITLSLLIAAFGSQPHGWTVLGTCFDRPGFLVMMEEVEAGRRSPSRRSISASPALKP